MSTDEKPIKGKTKAPSVYSLSNPARCYNCDAKLAAGAIVELRQKDDEREVLCAQCAGLQDFEVLPAGNAKWTRSAPKHSPNYYVVLKWSSLWKCYERQGLLVQKDSIEKIKGNQE